MIAWNDIRANWSRAERRAGIVVFALALAVRLAWVGVVELRGGALFGPDALSYDVLARNLLKGEGLWKWDYQGLFADPHQALAVRSFRPPLLPVVLAGLYGVVGHRLWAARLVMAVLSAAACLAVMRLARRVFDARVALLTGLLMAVYPKLVYYAGAIVTENLYILLLALALWALVAGREAGGWWRWATAGGLLGLATLCRSALLAFPPVACLWVVVARPRWRSVAEGALVALGFAAVMSPWWIRNAGFHGRFIPATTEGGLTFWVCNRRGADGGGHVDYRPVRGEFEGLGEAEIDRRFYRLGLAEARAAPGNFARLLGAKFIRFWRPWPHASEPSVGPGKAALAGATFIPLIVLAIWGAVASRAQWRPLSLIYLLFAYYTALHMVFMAVTRYRLPLEPYLMMLAASALAGMTTRER